MSKPSEPRTPSRRVRRGAEKRRFAAYMRRYVRRPEVRARVLADLRRRYREMDLRAATVKRNLDWRRRNPDRAAMHRLGMTNRPDLFAPVKLLQQLRKEHREHR